MKILLVEDDKSLFEQLKKELEHWDLQVSGIDAVSYTHLTLPTILRV